MAKESSRRLSKQRGLKRSAGDCRRRGLPARMIRSGSPGAAKLRFFGNLKWVGGRDRSPSVSERIATSSYLCAMRAK